MNLQEWKKKYVDEDEKPQEALEKVVRYALHCAMNHHSECRNGEGLEVATIYSDLISLIHNDEIEINFK
jgi:hypothetical protein